MAQKAPEERSTQFYNYPEPECVDFPHKEHETPTNPVLRGLPLYYGASVVASVQPVQSYLWSNAGFSKLRKCPEIADVPPRYDPTVIPIANNASVDSKPVHADLYTRPGLPLQAPGRFYSSADYHEAYKAGTLTPTAVVEALLPLISRDAPSLSPHSTAFLCSHKDLILAAAAASTQRYRAGTQLSVLDGVPVAVKDEVDLAGHRKSLGSKLDLTPAPNETSWCVSQWVAAGTIVLGKLNMHELGLDTTNNNPVHGTPLNPYNSSYYTGGSSGGSGYAVATGLVPFALGVDGGGSIRIPAAYCGVFGLKTSHGRVSGRPTSGLVTTTCVVGPLAANMADLEAAYRIMANPDPGDRSSSLFPTPGSRKRNFGPREKVLGVDRRWFSRADPEVRTACDSVLDYLCSTQGYVVVDITLPLLEDGQKAHAMTILAEIGSSFPDVTNFTPANKILLAVGAQTPAVDFLQAQKLRNLLMRHLAGLFENHPGLIVVTPTTPNAGWYMDGGKADLKYGISDANMSVRNMEYVWLANFCGCPALSVPVGYVQGKGDEKVPVALMGMGEWGSEDDLIEWGYDGEQFLNKVVGRSRPRAWVDVLKLAREG